MARVLERGIDTLVCGLYGLTPTEIKLVENGTVRREASLANLLVMRFVVPCIESSQRVLELLSIQLLSIQLSS